MQTDHISLVLSCVPELLLKLLVLAIIDYQRSQSLWLYPREGVIVEVQVLWDITSCWPGRAVKVCKIPPALVIFYQTLQCNIPEELNLQQHCSENVKCCRKASCFTESLVTALWDFKSAIIQKTHSLNFLFCLAYFNRHCSWYGVVPAFHWTYSSVYELGSSILHYGRFVQCLVFAVVADDNWQPTNKPLHFSWRTTLYSQFSWWRWWRSNKKGLYTILLSSLSVMKCGRWVLTGHRHSVGQMSIVIWAAFLEYLFLTILKEAFINAIRYSGIDCVKIVEYSNTICNYITAPRIVFWLFVVLLVLLDTLNFILAFI